MEGLARDRFPQVDARSARIRGLLLNADDASARQSLTDRFLGTRFLATPNELSRTLAHAERLDRVGFCKHNRGGGPELVVSGPWWMARRARRVLSLDFSVGA
jgi:hypothetical protein